eukprot:Phypoly_transcript_08821.p2 GENE.Phypoly_transcript_08821~~Phypoly_transcript_08821.p2  ORF type:complete len:159 (+),score=19.70 Phypoly_transcript_08821:739-1215(+)
MPVLAEGQKKAIQPLSVLDFADGILASLTRQNAIGQTYVLGGPEVMTWKDIADKSFESNRRRDKRVEVSEKVMDLAAGILEKGWYLGGEPILTRAEAKHYDSTNVVVRREDKSFTDLGLTHKLGDVELGLARVSRVYRDPAHQSDLLEQSPHGYKDTL